VQAKAPWGEKFLAVNWEITVGPEAHPDRLFLHAINFDVLDCSRSALAEHTAGLG
jgi:hypothetical protein